MKKLQEITIKVPEEIAEVYRQATEAEKQEIELEFTNIILIKTNQSQPENLDKLGKIMDEISRKAIERGLTPQILEEILADE